MWEWIINLVNFLIYVMIFMKAIGTAYFNLLDLAASLIGITAGVIFLVYKSLKT